MIELSVKTIDFKLDNEVISLREPTIAQLKVVEKMGDDIDTLKDFFLTLGMTESFHSKLTPSLISIIIEAITGSKKK